MPRLSLSGLLLSGALLFSQNSSAETISPKEAIHAVEASPPPALPPRKLSLNLGSIYTFENNDLAWFSLYQLLGRGNDYLGLEKEADQNGMGRVGLALASTYFARGISFYKHEIAHEFIDSEKDFKIDFSEWFGEWTSPYPQFEHGGLLENPTDERIIHSLVDGLNQDAYSSYTTWEDSALKREFTFQEGIYFLFQKLQNANYTITAKRMHIKNGSNLNNNDINGYLERLQLKGISLSHNELLGQLLTADFLSWHTWESFYSVYNYLVNGERATTPATIEVTNNWEVSLPLFSVYFTSQGNFANTDLFISHGERSLELSVGSDLDYAGGGKLDTLRFGTKQRGVKLSSLELIPFGYVNLERSSFEGKGVSTGLEMLLPVTTSASVRGKWEYNYRDVIESEIKDEGNGNSIVLGVDIKI